MVWPFLIYLLILSTSKCLLTELSLSERVYKVNSYSVITLQAEKSDIKYTPGARRQGQPFKVRDVAVTTIQDFK